MPWRQWPHAGLPGGGGGLSHLRGLGEQQDRLARARLPGVGEEGVLHPPGPLPWFSEPGEAGLPAAVRETRVCPPVAYQRGPGGRTVHPHPRKANKRNGPKSVKRGNELDL